MEKKKDLELYNRAKKMLIRDLRLKKTPEDIKDSDPLFGSGLGLDSVDALELVCALEKEFGVRIPDSTVGRKVLASVDTMVDFIKEKQADKTP